MRRRKGTVSPPTLQVPGVLWRVAAMSLRSLWLSSTYSSCSLGILEKILEASFSAVANQAVESLPCAGGSPHLRGLKLSRPTEGLRLLTGLLFDLFIWFSPTECILA